MMTKPTSVSVIICTHNRQQGLRQCLASAARQDFVPREIIIIDDCSCDGTAEMLAAYTSEVVPIRIHRNEKNMGISYSRNKGAELASNEIIAFIDDDCVAEKDWLTELVGPFGNPRVAVVGGLIKDPLPTNISMVAAQGHYKRFTKEGPCGSLPGGAANLAVRKQFYLDNPVQNLALEDWELCQKAVDKGYLVYNCPRAVVRHEHYHNLKTLLRQRYRYGIGQTWFRKRYKPSPLNLKTILLLIAMALLPLIFLWKRLLIVVLIILFSLSSGIVIKDIRKGDKTVRQTIISFPVFVLIALSECYGRVVGLFKKPTQINFGTDCVRND